MARRSQIVATSTATIATGLDAWPRLPLPAIPHLAAAEPQMIRAKPRRYWPWGSAFTTARQPAPKLPARVGARHRHTRCDQTAEKSRTRHIQALLGESSSGKGITAC
jgi:hypothetical protein